MLDKPDAVVEELHKPAYGAMLFLVELPDFGKYYTNNISDVVWNGHTWVRLGFKIEPINEDSTNRAPEFMIHLSNLGGLVEDELILNDNFSRAKINVYFVNNNTLDETDPIYQVNSMEIQQIVKVDRKIVSIKVGLDNPLLLASPSWVFHDAICQYAKNGTLFKGVLCGYSGAYTTCNYTLSDCIDRGNVERFGAQPGLLGAIQDDE